MKQQMNQSYMQYYVEMLPYFTDNIMSKCYHILPTRTSFFILSAGKIESVQEFKVKLFELLFHCRCQSCKNCMATFISFHQTRYFAFWI